jgi:CBS domain-containing protein
MKVRDVMTSEVGSCQPEASLSQAATIMWQRDCGVVPVVDERQKIVGMITDRDICMATMMKNRLASEISVGEVIYGEVKTCSPGDKVEDALKTMKKFQLRRLPVVSKDKVLIGVLSISDLLRHPGKGKDEISHKKLFTALQEISHFRPVRLHTLDVEDVQDEESQQDDEQAEQEIDSKNDESFDNGVDNTNDSGEAESERREEGFDALTLGTISN